jgi:hypothetical protein
MIDKYEEHNRRVLDNTTPETFVAVINETMYDQYEKAGLLNLLDRCVVSRPLKTLVRYPGDRQRFIPVRPKYIGQYGGRKIIKN